MPRNWRKYLESVVAGAVLLSVAGTALAADGGFYVGFKTAGRLLNPSYSKDVTNRASATNIAAELRDRTLTSSDSTSGLSGGVGLVSGYRMPFGAEGKFSISGEFDAMLNFGKVSGKLPGASDPAVQSDGFNRLGENWPDAWSFRNRGHYGLTVKLGFNPVSLPGTSVYGLAGVRLINTLLKIDYAGCLVQADPISRDGNPANDRCPSGQTSAGTLRFPEHLTAWTVGAGVEKTIWQNIGLQFEARYVGYEKSSNAPFSGSDDVVVVHNLTNGDVELSLNLIWFFL